MSACTPSGSWSRIVADTGRRDILVHRLTECNEGTAIWLWKREIIAQMLRTDQRRIPADWCLRPHFQFWPPQRLKAILWLVELKRNLMAHGEAREEKWRGKRRMEWVASTHALYGNTVYPALLTLMRTPRLPAADWTDNPADINGLVRFAGRPNLVSARVPSHSVSTLAHLVMYRMQQQRHLSLLDCTDFLRRPRWKSHRAASRMQQVGNYRYSRQNPLS